MASIVPPPGSPPRAAQVSAAAQGKRPKRAHGEGTAIRRRADGLWYAAITDHGRRRWLYGKTQAVVRQKLTQARRELDAGRPAVGTKLGLVEYLEDWLVGLKPSVSYGTWQRYVTLLRLHVVPQLGRVGLDKLTPGALRQLYAERQAAGLAAATVRQLHVVLHHALADATRDGLVGRNVAGLVKAPRAAPYEAQPYSAAEARQLLAAVAGQRLEALYVLALHTAQRMGELLALRWRDVDFATRSLRIRGTLQRAEDGTWQVKTTKTRSTRHPVLLTAQALAALGRQQTRQQAEGLAHGEPWSESRWVFPGRNGGPLLLRDFHREHRRILQAAGLRYVRPHDFRHTTATLLLEQGVHQAIVADLLGHASPAITQRIYSHVTETIQQQAIVALERVFGA